MVLAAAAEDVFLDGSNARFAALLVIETVVCSIFVIAQRAVWSALDAAGRDLRRPLRR